MKETNRLWKGIWKATLIISLGSVSCASPTPLSLKNRVLLLDPEKAALVYPKCTKRGWLLGRCKEMGAEYYDLTKPDTRKMLNELGFECSVPAGL